MNEIWDVVVHTDEYLLDFARKNAKLVYLLLFLIVFSESANLLFAFLPGDGLLLAVGVIAATGTLNIWIIYPLLVIAGVIGYQVNYATGQYYGKRFLAGNHRIKRHFEKTQAFYKRHGDKAVIVGRFFPIVRTFAPFLAGVVKMDARIFLKDTIIGAIIWVSVFLLFGYFLGDIPIIKENFFLLYLALIALAVVPLLWTGLTFFLKKLKDGRIL